MDEENFSIVFGKYLESSNETQKQEIVQGEKPRASFLKKKISSAGCAL